MIASFIGYPFHFAFEILGRYIDLLAAPVRYSGMLWIILPLVVTIFVMELYFGIHAGEHEGWDSAVGNSLFLILVGFDLFRQVLRGAFAIPSWSVIRDSPFLFGIAGLVTALGLLMLILTFLHAVPRKLAFSISSILPVNLFAYVSIILVYTNLPGQLEGIPIDGLTVIAAIALLLSLLTLFGLLHLVLPHARD